MDSNTKDIVKFGIIIGLGYYVGRAILQKFNLAESDEQIESNKLKKKAQEEFVVDALKQQKPTISNGEASIIAEAIYGALNYSGISKDRRSAFLNIIKIKNNADFALVWKYFGTRQDHAFGVPVKNPQNLASFIATNMNSDYLNLINANFAKKKIKFRF